MRTFLIAATAALTAGLSSVAPAHATYWACMGGHVACGTGSSKSASKPSYKKQAYKKSAKKAKKQTNYVSYSAPKKKNKTYSGGSSAGGGVRVDPDPVRRLHGFFPGDHGAGDRL